MGEEVFIFWYFTITFHASEGGVTSGRSLLAIVVVIKSPSRSLFSEQSRHRRTHRKKIKNFNSRHDQRCSY